MSDQDDALFGKDGEPVAASVTEPATPIQEPAQDPFVDQLGTILREDGTQKFTDVASALDSIPHQDKHISTIEGENAELKASLEREKAAKELLQKAANNQEPAQQTLTPEQVAEIAAQAMVEKEAADKQEANVNLVRSQFSKQYGDKAGEEMGKLAEQSGMTKAQLKALSASSPQAVLQLAGIKVDAPVVHKTPYSPGNDQPSPQPQPSEPKSVMGGANTKDMVDAWRGAGERIKQT